MDKLTEEIAKELTIEMIPDGIWKAIAIEIGAINLVKLMAIVNGDDIYIPKPDRILIPARDSMIKKEFNGYNFDTLAKKYGLSTGYIKNLCGDGFLRGQCTVFDLLNKTTPE